MEMLIPATTWGNPEDVVQLLSCAQLFATPGTAARRDSLSFTVSQSLLKLMSIKDIMLSETASHKGEILCYFT